MPAAPPTLGSGKICYLEISADDAERSAAFYRDAFGWELRTRGDGAIAFDDGVREVSGAFTTRARAASEPGILVYVMAPDIAAMLAAARAAGGEVVRDLDPTEPEKIAHVRDPAGNVIGIYEQPGLAASAGTVTPVPEHLRTVTARLVVEDGAAALDFYRAAFGAEELGERFTMPDGQLVHSEIRVGDAVIFVTEGEGYRSLLATYWPDVDPVWQRAVDAGAEVMYPLADQFYGDRSGRLADPFGHEWVLATRIDNLSTAEVAERAQAAG